MKVVFLDVDGVLNSDLTLYENISLEDTLIERLKRIIDFTHAKIVLSSSWRCLGGPLRRLMDKLDSFGMHISSMTYDGVDYDYISNNGFTPTQHYTDKEKDIMTGELKTITRDRGAEIFLWLQTHYGVDKFAILDDEDEDIKDYFPNNLIKTNPAVGLSDKDVDKTIKMLNC